MIRHFVCIICPNGCELTAEIDGDCMLNVSGGLCKRGRDYVEGEITNPMRTISSSILVDEGELPLASVRVDRPIPKRCIFECMDVVKAMRIKAPVHIGQVVLTGVCGSEASIIITKNIERV